MWNGYYYHPLADGKKWGPLPHQKKYLALLGSDGFLRLEIQIFVIAQFRTLIIVLLHDQQVFIWFLCVYIVILIERNYDNWEWHLYDTWEEGP